MKRLFTVAAALLATAAAAQYKVVEPDGRITYTDRPPTASNLKVTELRRAPPPAIDPVLAALPLELRQVVQRYPVQLYTVADCPPCEAGRQLLRQRGVPFTERKLVTEDDVRGMERALGWRTVPSVTIGAQALRGFSPDEWPSYLDAAGYPRESRLPRGWAPATPPAGTPSAASAPSNPRVAAAPAAADVTRP